VCGRPTREGSRSGQSRRREQTVIYGGRCIHRVIMHIGQLPTPEGVGLSVDSRTSRSHTKTPRLLLSKSGLSQVAFSTGVGAVRSASPTSGLADRQPVHPRISAPDGRVSQFVPKSNQAYALPPTAKAGGLPRCYRCEGNTDSHWVPLPFAWLRGSRHLFFPHFDWICPGRFCAGNPAIRARWSQHQVSG
jgi:hypothetical protein